MSDYKTARWLRLQDRTGVAITRPHRGVRLQDRTVVAITRPHGGSAGFGPLVGVVMRTRAMYMARGMSLRRAMRMMTEMMVIWGGAAMIMVMRLDSIVSGTSRIMTMMMAVEKKWMILP